MMDDNSFEGYDYQFIDPSGDDQKCPICHLVVRDAYQVNCCGKILCNCCLVRCRNGGSNTCPMCREDMGDKHFKDTKSDREIKSLRVYCSYKDGGCEWTGELRGVEKHIHDCAYYNVNCPDCDQVVLKCHLPTHRSDECPDVKLDCQNAGCTEQIKRCKMSAHIEVCPKKVIKCPFNHMGCEFKSERQNVMTHIEREGSSHISMVARKIHVHDRVAPLVVKITGIKQAKDSNKKLVSDGFYTGLGGYKVFLKIYPNGIYSGRSTHLSVYVNLMPGANDDTLEFPFRGTFTITLLNQLKDDNHHTVSLIKENGSEKLYCSRKYKLDDSGWGENKFISHTVVGFNQDCKTPQQYLYDDTLYFRVNVKISSKTKPWLAVP